MQRHLQPVPSSTRLTLSDVPATVWGVSRRLRRHLRLLPLAALALLLLAPAARAEPNVVVVMTDDQALSQMRALPKTKALIGDAGVTFQRSYAAQPKCCPNRATFLTGQYAHNHGVRDNEPPDG